MLRMLFAALLCGALGSARATGFLTVESSPNGAEVWYTGPDDPDRKYLGDTPLENRELPTGRYNLWLILTGADTLAVPDISVHEGQHTLVNREIPTHYGYLEMQTSPDSAEIWLDGVKVGVSPFENNLMLPGDRKLRIDPRESHFRNTARKQPINKGDTLRLKVESAYRNKSFLHENLSLPPWRLGLEFGLQRRMTTGYYDTTKRDPFSNREKRAQLDIPVAARLGLPKGFEAHFALPFKSYDDKDSGALFRSNMTAGLKFTHRPYNVGADITWGIGFAEGVDALPNDFLALTLMGMASKGDIVVDAQAGFEFHFSDKDSSEINYGDQAKVHGRIGYLIDPWLPYLDLTGRLRLNSADDGESREDGGYLVIPEIGFTVEIDQTFSFQMGVPFTVLGRRGLSYWGIHASVSLAVDIL
jgi:hypothetical protein